MKSNSKETFLVGSTWVRFYFWRGEKHSDRWDSWRLWRWTPAVSPAQKHCGAAGANQQGVSIVKWGDVLWETISILPENLGIYSSIFKSSLNSSYSSIIDYFKDPWNISCFAGYSFSSDRFFWKKYSGKEKGF